MPALIIKSEANNWNEKDEEREGKNGDDYNTSSQLVFDVAICLLDSVVRSEMSVIA